MEKEVTSECKKLKLVTPVDVQIVGLPQEATEKDLEHHFGRYGSLTYCEIARDPTTKQSLGTGVLSYSSLNEAEDVLATPHTIDGRHLNLRCSRPKHLTESIPPGCSIRVFVGCLPFGSTCEDLKRCFSSYSSLHGVTVSGDFGYVSFKSAADVERVLDVTHVLKGSVLNVSLLR